MSDVMSRFQSGEALADLIREVQEYGGIPRRSFFWHIHLALESHTPILVAHEIGKANRILRQFALMKSPPGAKP